MTPELARYIRVARNQIYGTPIDEEAERRSVALQAFRGFLARKIELEVRFELFHETSWQSDAGGCSLRFSVDEQQFLLLQRGKECELYQGAQTKMALLAVLADDEAFQDRFLIAIDDCLQSSSSES